MAAELGSTTYVAVTWTAGDVITEAKLDNMVANDQAYDAHSAQGLLLNNNKSFASKNNAGSANLNLAKLDASDKMTLGDTGVGLNASGIVVDEDDMASDSAEKLPTQQSVKKYVDMDIRASAYRPAIQSIPNNTWTTIQMSTENFDEGGDFDNSTYTFTVPTGGDGLYLITAQVFWSANGANDFYLDIYKNGTTSIARDSEKSAAGNNQTQRVTRIAELSATDTILIRAYQNSGGAVNIVGGQDDTYFDIVRISAT